MTAREHPPFPAAGRWPPFSRAEAVTLALLALASVLLVAIALSGDRPLVAWLTSEQGPLEWTGAIAWFVLASVLVVTGGVNRCALTLAAVCVVFGARELDLHKLAVFGSVSFLKINFYRGDEVTLGQKLLGGVVAAGVLLTVFGGLAINALAFVRRRLYRLPWGRLVVAAGALLVLSKFFDRLPAVLADDYGRPLDWTTAAMVYLHEEWLEAFVPLLLIAAAWLRRRDGRRMQSSF